MADDRGIAKTISVVKSRKLFAVGSMGEQAPRGSMQAGERRQCWTGEGNKRMKGKTIDVSGQDEESDGGKSSSQR